MVVVLNLGDECPPWYGAQVLGIWGLRMSRRKKAVEMLRFD